ncbi:hypothetical protein [Nostocoides vanveenii]|uniref:hypothetical protein n=1 Tax=Nostocoides vanveenii TaxID=330835 RepID=UPI0031D130B9
MHIGVGVHASKYVATHGHAGLILTPANGDGTDQAEGDLVARIDGYKLGMRAFGPIKMDSL